MKVQEVLDKAQESLTVKKVFGEPYERDGVTIIPAANLQGGAGGGGDGEAGGGGFGLQARPAGAFIIKGGEVQWQPAVDVNRALLVGIAGLLILRSLAKAGLKIRRARD